MPMCYGFNKNCDNIKRTLLFEGTTLDNFKKVIDEST